MEINEEKLIVLLKEHFPTRKEFSFLVSDVSSLRVQQDTSSKQTQEGFDNITELINERFDELKASATTVDTILEEHPIERIERLEKHNNLPVFKLNLVAE